jgi:CRISPR-associated endonuclease/helicase Cas3
LKAVIRSGHVFVRLAALTNKVVVIDEIHAYETYMSTLLDRLLTWLGRLGVSVVMASATLPAGRRRELVASWQSGLLRCLARDAPSIEPSDAYPRVTLAGAGEPIVQAANVSAINASQTTRLMRVSDDETVDWILEQVRGGGSVAVMHNLVRRVEDTYAALKERIDALPSESRPKLIKIHGKLDLKERRDIETWLRSAFGPQGTRPHAIVVSSQVLEQGLDLDFDTMITDLAPVDWLIQRAGRLHRHERGERRGEPVLAITGVADTEVGPRFPPYSDRVYAPMVMLRTWALLRERTVLSRPNEVPSLVDTLYGDPGAVTCPAGWENEWQDAEAKFIRDQKATERNGRIMYLPLPDAISHLGELTKNSKDSRQTREKRGRS